MVQVRMVNRERLATFDKVLLWTIYDLLFVFHDS